MGHVALAGALVVVCAVAITALVPRRALTEDPSSSSRQHAASDVRLPFGGLDHRGATRGLSFEALQLYLLARSELGDRRPGFASRLRADAADLIAAAPEFAPAYALRAVACSISAAFATQRSITLSDQSEYDAEASLTCAHRAVRRALEIDPRLPEAHAAAGLLSLQEYSLCRAPCDQLGYLDAAQMSLELAVRIDPSLPEARTWLSKVYQERGDFVHASEQAEAALALDPLNPVAAYNANNFRMARGDNATVRERLLVLARRPGSPPYVYAQLAENALGSGQIEEALRWSRRLAGEDKGRAVQVTAAAMLARLGHYYEARALLAAAEDPTAIDRGETLWFALEAHLCSGGPSAVRAYLETQERHREAGARTPLAADAVREWRQFQGLALVLAGEPARAIPLLEQVFGTSGAPRIHLFTIEQEADVANALAWAYRQLGNSARSREVAEGTLAALERVANAGFDKQPRFALTQALACELAGHRDEARAAVARAVSTGWAQTADVNRDPRWAGLMATGVLRLAGTRSP
jgi:tetratricopeptide (TPR) repeat protein